MSCLFGIDWWSLQKNYNGEIGRCDLARVLGGKLSVSLVGSSPSPWIVGMGLGNPLPTRVTIRNRLRFYLILGLFPSVWAFPWALFCGPWLYLNTMYPNRGAPEGYTHVTENTISAIRQTSKVELILQTWLGADYQATEEASTTVDNIYTNSDKVRSSQNHTFWITFRTI